MTSFIVDFIQYVYVIIIDELIVQNEFFFFGLVILITIESGAG